MKAPKITLQNYEAYLLDLAEGNLTDAEKEELSLFFIIHPHLKINVSESFPILLNSEKIIFSAKEKIKKYQFQETTVHEENIHDFAIAHFEKLLDPKKTTELFSFLKRNPQFQHHFEQYSKCYLQGEFIPYEHKNRLYQRSKTRPLIRNPFLWSAAASILVVVAITFNHYSQNQDNKQLVQNKPAKQVLSIAENTPTPAEKMLSKKKVLLAVEKKQERQKIRNIESIAQERPQLKQNQPFREETSPLKTITPLVAKTKKIAMSTEDSIMLAGYNLTPTEEGPKIAVLPQKAPPVRREENNQLTLFKLAKLGIQGINSITNAKMKLTKTEDANGNLSELTFESDYLKIYKKVKN